MKISVIVPMFNSETFIVDCVNSILAQTFQDFELLLIDDCSIDGTVELIRSRYNDPRIRLVLNARKKMDWGSRNLGIQLARGEYVYFMDHDDVLFAGALETLWHGVEISGADTIHFNQYMHDTNGIGSKNPVETIYKIRDTAPPWKFVPEDVEWRLFHRDFTLQVMPWQKLIRRKFLIDYGIYFPPVWISSDSLLFFAELCLARKIFVVDGLGYVYRNNPKSQMHNDAEKQFQHSIENFLPFINYMEEIFSKDLVTPLSRELQLKYELKFFHDLNFYLARKIYSDGTPIEKIDSIINQRIKNGDLQNSKSVRMLFHMAVKSYISSNKEA
ncbi:MAG: glycosyltransferase family 2 protein [Selenomonadaceae bacterium]|nr:glycosyltransferase family 2 protein [Selenomonadaceae bacterium]